MGKILGIAAVVIGLCAATVAVSAWEWGQVSDTSMSSAGYISLAIGAVVTMSLGIGLMGLIFYSSRRGYDEPPQLEISPDGKPDTTTNL